MWPKTETKAYANTAGTIFPAVFLLVRLVVRGGVEPPTFRFSGGRSYQLSYLTVPGTGPGSERS